MVITESKLQSVIITTFTLPYTMHQCINAKQETAVVHVTKASTVHSLMIRNARNKF